MSRLITIWVVLAGVAVGMSLWERNLGEGEVASRDVQFRIGRLIRAAEREAIDATAVSIRTGENAGFLYLEVEDGVYRCPAIFNAIADADSIQALMNSLLNAEGVVVSRDPEKAKSYGFDLPGTMTVALHGPDVTPDGGDERFAVELGRITPDGKGCYVRRHDDAGVWVIESNPYAPLALEKNRGRPPLLDPSVIPRIWPGESRRIDRQEVTFFDSERGASYAISIHDIEITEEEMRKGKSPYEWHLHVGDAETVANHGSAVMWSSFIFFAPWSKIIDPSVIDRLGFDDPWARVVLQPAIGEPGELILSKRPLDDGSWPIRFVNTNGVYSIPTAVRDLLVPRVDVFDESYTEDPWRPYFQR